MTNAQPEPAVARGPETASVDVGSSAGLTDAALERLHDLRLRGMAPLPADAVTDALIAGGLLEQRGAYFAPTRKGTALVGELAILPEGSSERELAVRVYEAFLPLNAELIDVCAVWQLLPSGVLNDHADSAYDWVVQERLAAVHQRMSTLLRRLDAVAARFGRYGEQLEHARVRVESGESQFFASPRVDSYHTVWMRLHEDLLLAVGVSREDEARRLVGEL